ncbi:cyclic nucleotide-binding domain-containing protein [Candidatus Omnitrophota bacterium]
MTMSDKDKKFVRSKEVINLLNNIPMFDKLNFKEIKILALHLVVKRCKQGEVLFEEGDKGDFVFFVVSGTMEVIKTSRTSSDVVIAHLGKGKSIGEMAIIDDYPRSATIRAQTQAVLLILTRERFDNIIYEYSSVGIKVLKGVSRQISLNLRKASSRLAEYMLPL